MYITDFDAFFRQAEELFRARPAETRYVVKYRNCDGKLVVKVTDDVTCLQYKTDQQADLKRLERLNNLFLALAAKGDATPDDIAGPASEQPQQSSQPHRQAQGQAQQGQGKGSKKSRQKG